MNRSGEMATNGIGPVVRGLRGLRMSDSAMAEIGGE
jgi:hypothetical protein